MSIWSFIFIFIFIFLANTLALSNLNLGFVPIREGDLNISNQLSYNALGNK